MTQDTRDKLIASPLEEAVERVKQAIEGAEQFIDPRMVVVEPADLRTIINALPDEEITQEMAEAGVSEAFNQAHRTYTDMCRAIYRAMRKAAISTLYKGAE
jgi:hypothetical protein